MHAGLSKFAYGARLDGELVITDRPLTFLPIPVLEKGIYKLFYIGYRATFQAIIDILSLSGPESLPTVQRLRLELANGARDGRYPIEAVQYFAESGGSVRYALDYVVHQALWESPTPLGDGSFDKLWDESRSPPLTTPMVRIRCLLLISRQRNLTPNHADSHPSRRISRRILAPARGRTRSRKP